MSEPEGTEKERGAMMRVLQAAAQSDQLNPDDYEELVTRMLKTQGVKGKEDAARSMVEGLFRPAGQGKQRR